MSGADIVRMESDDDIVRTRDVMLQLRPHIPAAAYLPTVRRMMRIDGFRLAAVVADGRVRAVAGYRFIEMLYCGRILVVDDLVTDAGERSRGHGTALLSWLKDEARRTACGQVHLDSRVQRELAHRFYFREGFAITCFHFCAVLDPAG
ncbi:MAG TPA: GNAT family N-acetyltransferase [Gemmatimonadaceae bacterium]|nr:GNAT family N-acetyltransferase [Gemmatimonadaceae bacterium]